MDRRDFSTNATSPISGAHNHALLTANHILHLIGGQILLPILLITLFLGGEARKNPLLANFCFSWILFSAVDLILFYGGRKTSETPTIQICLVQASLNYGVEAMTVITSCSIVIQAWHYLRMSTKPNASVRIYGWRTTALMILSYCALLGYASAGIIIGVNSPQDIGRSHNIFVCDISHHLLATSVGWLCGVVGLIALFFGLWILLIIYRNRQTIRYWRLYHTSSDFAMIVRTLVFVVYGMMIVVTSILAVEGVDTTYVYMYIALLPLFSFFVFGTRHATTDLWRKWLHLPPAKSRRTPNAQATLTNIQLQTRDIRTHSPDPTAIAIGDPSSPEQERDAKGGYWGLPALSRNSVGDGQRTRPRPRPKQPQSRPSELALYEEEMEGSLKVPLNRGDTDRFVSEEDTWGYKAIAKDRDGETPPGADVEYVEAEAEADNLLKPTLWKERSNIEHRYPGVVGASGPTLRRGWSQLPEEHEPRDRDLSDDPRPHPRGPRPQPTGTGEWEEVAIDSPASPGAGDADLRSNTRDEDMKLLNPNPKAHSQIPSSSTATDDYSPGIDNQHGHPTHGHPSRPTISSWASSTSTARRIPPPELLSSAELLPDGDDHGHGHGDRAKKKLKRPAVISWTSAPYLPVAARFESRDVWEGPY